MTGEPQIIRTPSGDEMVVMPRTEYEALRAAAEDAMEDAADLEIARDRWRDWNESGRLTTPPDVAQMVLQGHHILEAFRHERGMSIDDLAERSAVAASQIRAIETRDAPGDAKTMSALADALGIAPAWLLPSQSTASR